MTAHLAFKISLTLAIVFLAVSTKIAGAAGVPIQKTTIMTHKEANRTSNYLNQPRIAMQASIKELKPGD